MEFVKHEMGDGSPESLATILAALFDKIHPLAIGAMQQSYELSRLISTKALSTHMDPANDKEKIERIVTAFSDEFFSHHYRIGWREAKGTGLKVTVAGDALWELIWCLFKHYQAYFTLAREFVGGRQVAQPIAWIDSSSQRRILENVLEKAPDQGKGLLQLQKAESRWVSADWQRPAPTMGEERTDALS